MSRSAITWMPYVTAYVLFYTLAITPFHLDVEWKWGTFVLGGSFSVNFAYIFELIKNSGEHHD